MQSSDGAAGTFLLPGKRTGSFLLCSYILMGVAALTFGVVFGSVYVGLTVLVFGYILIACTQKSFDARTAASAVAFSFIVGVVVAMLMYFGYIADYGEPFWVPGADDQVYEQVAKRAYDAGYTTVFDMFNSSDQYIRQHNAKGWVIYIVYLMRLGDGIDGYHSMVPRIINIFALNIMGLIVARCFSRRYDISGKWLACALLCVGLFPNALIISSHVYRDTVNALLVASCYFLALDLRGRKHRVVKILLIAVLAYVSYWLRAMSVFFIAGLVAAALLPGTVKQLKSNLAILVITAMVVLVGSVLFALNSELFLGYVTRYGESIATGESRFVSLIYGLPMLPLGLPLRIAVYLCSPFYYRVVYDPLSWFSSTENVAHLFVSFGTVVLVAHYVYALRGLKEDYRSGLGLLVVLVGICISTSGHRHIMMVYPLLILLIMEGRYIVGRLSEARLLYRAGSYLFAFLICLLFGAVSLL